ncbi:thiopeptide-type bacteriocin biosynthesis protein [Streptomyces sp. F63]|uniref:thiopeptide-type bacteriocin biosynthesis protein n=1 Tax=Streptomyces sp. F63 TaxID=2824887 RepID=UPI001B381945|nr:thiopeptide-type bacteriocin biosynthesis protein [Streptomyces sp. F63]MBQ0984068.1 thiopeptide-type bacteriocin biosynthesis protein [Streptomyces sp. F63]
MDHRDTDSLEDAVLSVLTGSPIELAAARTRTSPARLADAVGRYRAAGRAALGPQPSGWHQVNIEFADYPTAERSFRAHLLPALSSGAIGEWWFVRKHPCWRLRIHPGPDGRTADAIARITEALDNTLALGEIRRWRPALYEPESVAFGGPEGIRLTHSLFHADSVGVLDYQQHAADGIEGLPGGKETSFLVAPLFLRAAGLEWGEQGDVWGRVEARRPLPAGVSPEQVSSMAAPLQRLLLTDARPAIANGPLTPLAGWITGMQRGGRALAEAAHADNLQLGLRSLVTRHILFHWNRLGFTAAQQAIWARAAREAILGS